MCFISCVCVCVCVCVCFICFALCFVLVVVSKYSNTFSYSVSTHGPKLCLKVETQIIQVHVDIETLTPSIIGCFLARTINKKFCQLPTFTLIFHVFCIFWCVLFYTFFSHVLCDLFGVVLYCMSSALNTLENFI